MTTNGATSTWSGYTHQGKVGLIVALQEICRLINSCSEEQLTAELKKWRIIFETSEDFDIRNDEQIAWSRHQVKARGNKGKQNHYNDVLLPDKNGKNGFDIDKVKTGECYLHVITKIAAWDETVDKNPQSIKLYTYPPNNDKFCSFAPADDIDTMYPIYSTLVGKISATDNQGTIRVLWALLEHMLDDSIRQGHRNGTRPELCFEDIRQYLIQDNSFVESHYYRLKRLLNGYWDVRERIKLQNGESINEDWVRAREAFESLCALETQEFLRAINIMHPHETGEDYNANPQGLKKVVYEGLERIKQPIDIGSMSYAGDIPFVLTALAEDDDMLETYAEGICAQMTSNPNITAQLFRESTIINLTIDGSFHELLKKTNQKDVVHETVVVGGIESEHITDPANLKFMKLENAITKINSNGANE